MVSKDAESIFQRRFHGRCRGLIVRPLIFRPQTDPNSTSFSGPRAMELFRGMLSGALSRFVLKSEQDLFMNKQTWCQTFGKNMVKRKNILRISLVLLSNHEIWLNINTHFFILGPYSNTSYYSSFYLQNLGKTAKCSCWLKMLVISDLPVEPPKNCALRDPPHGVWSHARRQSREGSGKPGR